MEAQNSTAGYNFSSELVVGQRYTPESELVIESEVPFDEGAGEITCPCGRKLYLHFNGGELDRVQCTTCGRVHQTEIRSIVLVTKAPRG